MDLIRNYIFKQVAEKKLSVQDAEKMINELAQNKVTIDGSIAIIGMSGKYPGSDNLEEFWDTISNKKIVIDDFPDDRRKDGEHMLQYPYYGEVLTGVPITKENVTYPKGGYLKDGIDKFDWNFFGISPREALFIDPSNRLFLETAWEAIEDAGYGGNRIYGTKTGVFVGQDTTNISLYKHMTEMDTMHLTGSWAGYLSSRIAYLLNLTGPSMVVDTACSSGLVSVHNACKSIQSGECDMALAGGVNVLYMAQKPKGESIIMDLGMVESENDVVRPFDDRANGTAWGEGIGAFILKPLKNAIKDRDNIHAIIKGSAINNDGASNGITAPNAIAQENVICDAWKNAKVNPETISYIEAHGTATRLGDSIELKGLNEAFRKHTDKKQFCAVGSAKSSIGHTVAASGIAALSKIILGMKHGKIPPSTNFDRPNQYIDFCNSPIYIADKMTDWVPNGDTIRAGLSSFGFTGTNCHVIVEESPSRIIERENVNRPHIFTLSAKNENVLRNYIKKYKKFLEQQKDLELLDLCYTASYGRGHYESRIAIIAESTSELREKITKLYIEGINSYPETGIYYGYFKLVSGNRENKVEGTLTDDMKWELENKGNELILKWLNDSSHSINTLEEICSIYTSGAEIEWLRMYEGFSPCTLSLPYYPLERNRCWANPKQSVIKDYATGNSNKIGHLLLDWLVADVKDHCVYLTNFNVKDKWVISEHKFLDNYVLPGISYLELGRKACSRFYGEVGIELRDVVFMEAMVVGDEEEKIVYTDVENKGTHLIFQIMSKEVLADGNERWAIHAEGKAYKIVEEADHFDIENLVQDFDVPGVDLESDIGKKEFGLGERWDTIRSIKIKDKRNLVEIELNEKFEGDLEGLVMHPSMLDNAANAALLQIKSDIYLPFSYKSLKIFNKFPSKIYSYIRCLDELNSGKETISFDVTLLDEQGQVIVEIEHYTIKKVNKSEQRRFEDLAGKGIQYFNIGWKQVTPELKDRNLENIMVICADNKKSSELISILLKKDIQVTEVKLGSEYKACDDGTYIIGDNEKDYLKLANIVKEKKISDILHLKTFDFNSEITSIDDLEKSQDAGVYNVYQITKAILNAQIKQKIRINLIAPNVDDVSGDEDFINPQHATLMGLGKVIIQEYPNIELRCIDCDEETDNGLLIAEVCNEDIQYRVAYRKGQKYVEELRKIEKVNDDIPELKIQSEGAYIITGGTGGIGLAMAKHLSERNPVHLALINRSIFPEKEEWDKILKINSDSKLCEKISVLKNILDSGSSVDTISADIGNLLEMDSVFTGLKEKYGKINGILHCAGLAGDGYIMNKSLDVFKSVIKPKVQGTWILNHCAKKENLDFFVLFSSVTTLQSFPGQSDYTAANSYLDTYATLGRKKGINTYSINWPGWKSTGMAKDYDINDENMFFRLITEENALDSFDSILSMNESRILTGELNHLAITNQRDQLLISLSEEMEDIIKKYLSSQKRNNDSLIVVSNVNLFGKNEGVYTEKESVIGKIFGGVLGLAEVDVYQTFNEMGGDSILATQVYKEIDKVYPGVIDITDIFSYPTVVEMGKYIENALGEDDVETIEHSEEDEMDSKLMELINGVEKGEINIEKGLENI